MNKLSEQKELTKLEKQLEDYVDGKRAMSTAELDFTLLQLAKHKEEIVTTQNNDVELSDARAHVKELNAPYKEQLAENKKKARFIALLLKERADETPQGN